VQNYPDIDRFVCVHCASEKIVKRGAGVISLQPVMEGLQRVEKSVDKTAAVLAIVRLTGELRQSEEELDRWQKLKASEIQVPLVHLDLDNLVLEYARHAHFCVRFHSGLLWGRRLGFLANSSLLPLEPLFIYLS
jgi:superfamily II helicase